MALLIPLKVSASPQTIRLAVETPVVQSVTTDYEQLTGLPQINGVTLLGDKSAADLGLATPSQIPSVPGAYTSNPAALGASASPGSAASWARGDHVHPAELPTVTSSDNGKVLRVVSGAWAAASLLSAAGVSF